MSWFEYQDSLKIASADPDFYGIIMAAMRKADTRNSAILQGAYPEVWEELALRYHAPGGVLSTDPVSIQRTQR